MNKFLLFSICLLGITGCTELNQATKEAGKPVGGIATIPSSLNQGVTEGYLGEPNDNPYGR